VNDLFRKTVPHWVKHLHWMVTKFSGACHKCGKPVAVGEEALRSTIYHRIWCMPCGNDHVQSYFDSATKRVEQADQAREARVRKPKPKRRPKWKSRLMVPYLI
jgi:hypothetical protein